MYILHYSRTFLHVFAFVGATLCFLCLLPFPIWNCMAFLFAFALQELRKCVGKCIASLIMITIFHRAIRGS